MIYREIYISKAKLDNIDIFHFNKIPFCHRKTSIHTELVYTYEKKIIDSPIMSSNCIARKLFIVIPSQKYAYSFEKLTKDSTSIDLFPRKTFYCDEKIYLPHIFSNIGSININSPYLRIEGEQLDSIKKINKVVLSNHQISLRM